MMKKTLFFILLVFILAGCSPTSDFSIKKNKNYLNLQVNEKYKIANILDAKAIDWVSSNKDVVIIDKDYVIGVSVGQSIVTATTDGNTIIYIINVNADLKSISIEGKTELKIGESAKFTIKGFPEEASQAVIWRSSDEEVLEIDDEGNVLAKSFGLARIIATSKINKNIVTEKNIIVNKEKELISFEDFVYKALENIENININNYQFLEPLFRNSIGSVIGVNGFINDNPGDYGSGVIYKREVYLDDGSIIYDDVYNHLNEIDYFKYYVVSNEDIFRNASQAKVYYGEDYIDANIISMDLKSNLAVITFESKLYFPIAKFSDAVITKGESIFAVGNPEGFDYYQSISAGVVSNLERYISYDTDGDGTFDWGMMFIQHDAAISKGNYGGPLFNLKGEVIAINTRKVVSYTIEGMNFAIPIDEVEKIIAILEDGKIPQRVVLGVKGYDVSTILDNPSSPSFIDLNLYGASYGFYVIEINDGLATGIIRENDIIISFNNKDVKHLSDLRDELHRFLLGSGEIVPLKVIRNGEIIELYVEY